MSLEDMYEAAIEEFEQERRIPDEEISKEFRFRRGYHHGWENAIDAIFGMLRKGITMEEAYKLSAIYVNGIAQWRTRARHEGFNPPPYFDLDKLKKVLEYRKDETA